jgi:internalin A
LSSCKALKDLRPLAGLSQLKSLGLGWCERLKDVNPLAGLKQLYSLELTSCKVLKDLTPVAELTKLGILDLDFCEAVKDLSPLAGLTGLHMLGLEYCKRVKDLSPLAGMSQLDWLQLRGCDSVRDVSPLAGLSQLRSLSLSGKALKDLSPLAGLTQLDSLELSYCSEALSLTPLRTVIEHLSELKLEEGAFADLPHELCGTFGENVRDQVLDYFRARDQQGAAPLSTAKALIVGNGRAGKTTLVRRLQGQPADPDEPATHAIRLEQWHSAFRPVDSSPSTPPQPVIVNLRDFGGQDIYHHTHRLFFQGGSVFVIVWTTDWPPLGPCDALEQNPFRPLAYWLDQVLSLNCQPQVVLVRNRRAGEPLEANWRTQVARFSL